MRVPAQDGITRDNVTVRVDAVVYFRVVDPVRAVVNVQNYTPRSPRSRRPRCARSSARASWTTCCPPGAAEQGLELMIDSPAEGWGVQIDRVEIKDVALPESMKRSMSRQAEAERERRARVITADGEFQASEKLAQAPSDGRDTRPRCSCGCSRPWWRWRPRRTRPSCCRSRWSCSASWNATPPPAPVVATRPRTGPHRHPAGRTACAARARPREPQRDRAGGGGARSRRRRRVPGGGSEPTGRGLSPRRVRHPMALTSRPPRAVARSSLRRRPRRGTRTRQSSPSAIAARASWLTRPKRLPMWARMPIRVSLASTGPVPPQDGLGDRAGVGVERDGVALDGPRRGVLGDGDAGRRARPAT